MADLTHWFWSRLIPEFCKVQFLCYDGTPNWLGWAVLGWGVLIALAICMGALSGAVSSK
jgi:hypothetical protein